MNAKKLGVGLLILLGLAALISLSQSQIPLTVLLTQPLQALWGSPEQFQTGVLEVSGNIEPVEAATRRLLKPLGKVRLTRHYPPSDSPSPESPRTPR
jgi:hypothetical protein